MSYLFEVSFGRATRSKVITFLEVSEKEIKIQQDGSWQIKTASRERNPESYEALKKLYDALYSYEERFCLS